MMQPRWKKVIKDLSGNKVRTLLVILSITIGVFSVGTMVGTQILLMEELEKAYLQTAPSHAILFTDDVTTGFLQAVQTVDGVAQVDARKHETVLLHLNAGEPIRLNLVSRFDYEQMKLHTLTPIAGQWPPTNQTIVIEQASLPYTDAAIGDVILVEGADGTLRELTVSGTAHDLLAEPVAFTEEPYGYINRETMAWLGYGYGLDELFVRVEGSQLDKTQIETVTDAVQFKLGNSGRIPYFAEILEPDVHPATEDVEPMILLLGILAFLSLFAGSFLIINIITSLLTQQTKQIGIMKAYGATRAQMTRMYLVGVALYSLLALLIAIPLTMLAAYGLTQFMADLINFDLSGFRILPQVVIIQIVVALLFPMLAAMVPIRRGTSITIKTAINAQGLENNGKRSWLNRAFKATSQLFLRRSRPMQIAFRNAIRRKARLALTVITLTLSSAIFIGVMSVHASLLGALDDALSYFAYDLTVEFVEGVPTTEVENLVLQNPEVVAVESWIKGDAQRLHDGQAGMAFSLLGLDSESETIRPQLENGRWLHPDDTNAIVLDSLVLSREPDLQLGDFISLKVDGLQSEWEVVGFSQAVLTEDGVGYVNREYLAAKIGLNGKTTGINVISQNHTAVSQFELDKSLRESFSEAGFTVAFSQSWTDIQDGIQFEFNLIVGMLLVMAVLLSLVGGLGLVGTISINVLERTREIGVMRALGASSWTIRRIVMVEGAFVAMISWFFGSVLAYPLGKMMSDAVGNEVLESALNYQFALNWVFGWLFIIIFIALFASFWPAWNASRLQVRETLAYE